MERKVLGSGGALDLLMSGHKERTLLKCGGLG